MKKKVVIVTGASGNLGKATVEKFIQEGYTLAVALAPGETLGAYQDHPLVDPFYADLLNETEADRFIGNVIKKYNTIDAALLLVGGYAPGGISNTGGADIKKLYSLNFETAYHVARPVFNHMARQNTGKIILIGARPALVPGQAKTSLAYALSKSLIFKFAEILNADGAAHNVTATVIVPSIIDTPANRQAMPDADFSAWVKPEDIAATMAFVVSDTASPLRDTILKIYGKA